MGINKKQEYWLFAEAKNRFSEVTRLAVLDGPQKIHRRDGNIVVISERDYCLLKDKEKTKDFKNFLLQETPDLTDLCLMRDRSPMRDIEQ